MNNGRDNIQIHSKLQLHLLRLKNLLSRFLRRGMVLLQFNGRFQPSAGRIFSTCTFIISFSFGCLVKEAISAEQTCRNASRWSSCSVLLSSCFNRSLVWPQNPDMLTRKIKLCHINAHITCRLCEGYLIDATTVTECLHTCESHLHLWKLNLLGSSHSESVGSLFRWKQN